MSKWNLALLVIFYSSKRDSYSTKIRVIFHDR